MVAFFGDSSALQGAVLLLPAVAIGNLGELAVDVIVSSLGVGQGVELMGRLEEESVLPIAGADAFASGPPPYSGALATALELYHITGTRVVLLQQRAPVRKGCQRLFAGRLVGWARAAGVASCCVLCGLEDTMLKKDDQLLAGGDMLRYLAAADAGGSEDEACCLSLGWRQLEPDVLAEDKEVHSLLPPWPLLSAAQAAQLPALLLTLLVPEGDNRQHGLLLATRALQWLKARGLLQGSQVAAQLLQATPGEAVHPGAAGAEGQPPQWRLQVPVAWAAMYGPQAMASY